MLTKEEKEENDKENNRFGSRFTRDHTSGNNILRAIFLLRIL